MTTTTHREAQIVADPDVPTVTVTREFDAPPERVFKAWEDPELVKIWMGPRSVDMDIQAWDCRTGGSYRYVASRDGEQLASFYGSFHESRPGKRLVQTWTWEGMPDAVCLETMTFEALEGGRSRIVSLTVRRLHGGPGRHAGQRHGGRHQRGLREARRAAGVRSRMSPETNAASEEHRRIAGTFTDRVRGTTDWDAPAPVEGWTARDVVRHLVEWFPSFLEAGAGVRLASGPSVDDDPVAAWQVHSDAVQALLDDPTTADKVLQNRHIGEVPLDRAVDQFYTADVFMHTWDLSRATGQDETLDADKCAVMLAGMEPIEDAMRSSGQYGPRVEVPDDADVQTRMLAFIGRNPI